MNPFETVKWGKEDKIYELGISLDAKWIKVMMIIIENNIVWFIYK
jgi:hypothetical protein